MAVALIDILAAGVTDDAGEPLALGTVTFYLAGTTTPETVYEDFALATPHSNPLTLDDAGRAIAYSDTRVKALIKNASGATVRTIDNINLADSDISASSASALAGDGLSAAAGLLNVNVDGNTIETSSDAIRIKDAGRSNLDLYNYSIACSVASNALTIALKSNAGSDCTDTDYASIPFRSTTLTSGVTTRRKITAALSIVISSGSTLGHVSAVEWPIYVYAIDNAGTVELAVSTSPQDERYRLTTTVLAGGGGDDSVSAIYSTAARSNVAARLIAVLKSTQATAGTWAVVPTNVSNPVIGSPIASLVSRPSHTTVGVGGVALSSAASYSVTSSTADVTNLSVTITTSGRPVFMGLVSQGANGTGSDGMVVTDAGANGFIRFVRASTALADLRLHTSAGEHPCSAYWHIDYPAAGTYTYKVQANDANAPGCTITNAKLVVYEI